jgi:Arylsulfotransferase (ASST)
MGGAALEMDWKGRILWEVNHPHHNHDGIRLRNRNVLLICQKPLPAAFVPKVRGGRAGTEYDDGRMDAPYLVEMTIKGEPVWEWHSREHLDPEADMITAVQDDRDVWSVANGVSEMPDGNLILIFRDISTVIMINRRAGARASRALRSLSQQPLVAAEHGDQIIGERPHARDIA